MGILQDDFCETMHCLATAQLGFGRGPSMCDKPKLYMAWLHFMKTFFLPSSFILYLQASVLIVAILSHHVTFFSLTFSQRQLCASVPIKRGYFCDEWEHIFLMFVCISVSS